MTSFFDNIAVTLKNGKSEQKKKKNGKKKENEKYGRDLKNRKK